MAGGEVSMRRRFSVSLGFGLLACILTTLSFPQKKPDWKGRIDKEGDVVVVKNPRSPQYGAGAFSLEEDLSVGGQDSADTLLAEITSIAVDGRGVIFVLDGKDKDVKVFGQDGKHIKTLGKAGQGPGEFPNPQSIRFNENNEIVVVNVARLSIFDASGNYLRDISLGGQILMGIWPDSRGNYFGYCIANMGPEGRYELHKYDGAFKDLFVIESSPLMNSGRDGYDPFFPVLRWAPLPGGGVVCGHAVKPELRVHDTNGRLVRKIQFDPEPVPVAQEDVKERTEGTRPEMMNVLKVPKYYPAFRYLMSDDEGRIYVLSWERPPGRKGYYFDVFDSEGKYLARAVIPVLQPFILKGRLYASEESDEGYAVLKRYQIRWNF
jgi:hypothetical protein